MKRVTILLIKVKTCNALLRMLLVYIYISICLNTVLRNKLLVVDAYHTDTLYLREQ